MIGLLPYQDLAAGEGDVRKNWPAINAARAGARTLARQRRANLLDRARKQMGSDAVFPFKVYLAQQSFAPGQLPAAENQQSGQLPNDLNNWWRTICVRSGRVNNIPLVGAAVTSPVNALAGCDGHDANPDDDYYPQETDAGAPIVPITVPFNTSPFYLWIELVNNIPTLHYGINATTPDATANGTKGATAWPTFPAPDGVHWLIAICNSTGPYQNPALPYELIVRQILRADVIGAASNDIVLTFLTEADDWITCNPGGVLVAKPYHLRVSTYTNPAYFGGPYTRAGVNQRTTPGGTYTQKIWRPYAAGDSIRAFTPEGGTGVTNGSTPITLEDRGDSRAWATQLEYCDASGASRMAWLVGDYPQ